MPPEERSAVAGHYFQFPLCALATRRAPDEVANNLICYGTVAAGCSRLEQLDDEEQLEKLDEFGLEDTDRDRWRLAAILGGEVCDVDVEDVEDVMVEGYHEVDIHVWEFEQRHQCTSPKVRMTSKTLFEVRDGGSMSWREFRVLAGLYSVLGSKAYSVVPLSMIHARCCGCSSQRMLAVEVYNKEVDPLSIKQVRLTVEKLWMLKWFARVTPDPHGRATYYSHRMTEDELMDRIFARRTYKTQFLAAARAKALALQEKLDAVLRPDGGTKALPASIRRLAPRQATTGRLPGNSGASVRQREGDRRAP